MDVTDPRGHEWGERMIVYVDILLLLNIYVNYFLIRATSLILHRKIINARVILGAVIGSLFSLTILLPEQSSFVTFLIKIIAAALVVLIAFRFGDIFTYLKISGMFLAVNTIFAGFMLALWWFVSPVSMYFKNGTVYFDISFLVLAISTILAYFAIRLIRAALDGKGSFDAKVRLVVDNCKSTVELEAFLDSGNTLADMFSGKPVIICEYDKLKSVLPLPYRLAFESEGTVRLESLSQIKGVRLLPYKTVGGDGIIPSFQADGVYIKSEGHAIKPVDALIGISTTPLGEKACGAIINPKLLA